MKKRRRKNQSCEIHKTPENSPAPSLPKWSKGSIIALLVVVGVSLALNCTGLNWGQPGGYTWQADSIAGLRTVSQMPNLFEQWRFKYPRGHFLVNAALYKPILNHWHKNPVYVLDKDGKKVARDLTIQRVSTLIMISRFVTALMAAAAVIAVFMTARVLFADTIAAFFAGLTLAASMLFVLYSHTGNVDVPCTFWFAWSLYWAVKAVYISKWRHYILLGLFASFAICTKDPAGGFVVGLGLAMWITMAGVIREHQGSIKKALLCVFNKKVLVAFLLAVICFAVLNGMLGGTKEFTSRMELWKGVPARERAGSNTQLILLKKSWWNLYSAVGWPFLTFFICSLFYCAIKYRWKCTFGILPLAVFYVLVIMNIGFVVPRFFMTGYPCLALLAGKTSSDWLRWPKLPVVLRAVPIVIVYGLSVLYCIGLDLELVTESRSRAEKWLKERVNSNDGVVALSSATYAPRIHILGCRHLFFDSRPQTEQKLQKIKPFASYLVLGEGEFAQIKAFDQDYLRDLLAGKKGYKEVARFSNKFLYPEKTIFGFAGWPVKKPRIVSPETIILKRE